jgi:hypothetical protein
MELDMAEKSRELKDYRDIGEVVSPIEQLMAARTSSSCCMGQEAMLECDRVPWKQWVAMDWKPTGAA